MVVSESLHRARLSYSLSKELMERPRRRNHRRRMERAERPPERVSASEGAQTLALLLKLKPRLAHLDLLALACLEENH